MTPPPVCVVFGFLPGVGTAELAQALGQQGMAVSSFGRPRRIPTLRAPFAREWGAAWEASLIDAPWFPSVYGGRVMAWRMRDVLRYLHRHTHPLLAALVWRDPLETVNEGNQARTRYPGAPLPAWEKMRLSASAAAPEGRVPQWLAEIFAEHPAATLTVLRSEQLRADPRSELARLHAAGWPIVLSA